MPETVLIDGYNLGLEKGTGVATYARNLSTAVHELGYRVDVLYGLRTPRTSDPLLREAYFFNPLPQRPKKLLSLAAHRVKQVALTPVNPVVEEVPLTGRVVTAPFRDRLPYADRIWNSADLFGAAHAQFYALGRVMPLRLPQTPRIAHWTYPIPIRIPGAKNVYTLHDLVPLKLPHTMLGGTGRYQRMIRKLLESADHIVTVSEQSKRDICDMFGYPVEKITNTYQSVAIPQEYRDKPVDLVEREIKGLFNLSYQGYFLYFGAIEPKKNVGRLIEAYLSTNLPLPLIIVGKEAWKARSELALFEALEPAAKSRIRRLDHAPSSVLVSLIRGARAVLFPSLYEGFGLPVLEAMTLGTPVLTSREGSLPEVAGDAALLVDPYDAAAIAEGIRALTDPDLCAALSAKGLRQAELFSPERFRGRLGQVYQRLASDP
jgi:glycosyltransferase involved in cell wall biosynthesis